MDESLPTVELVAFVSANFTYTYCVYSVLNVQVLVGAFSVIVKSSQTFW